MPHQLLKLNDEMIAKAYEYMRHGNYVDTVCQLIGISDVTYYKYKEQAEKDIANGLTEENSLFVSFLCAIKRGEAEAEDEAIASIQRIGEKEWTAKAWMLERRHNAKWRAKQEIELSGSVNNAYDNLSEDELRALANDKKCP